MLMTNFKIILAYNGTAYHGWQRQNNALAVQQVLEEAILSLTGQTVTVNGCRSARKKILCKLSYRVHNNLPWDSFWT